MPPPPEHLPRETQRTLLVAAALAHHPMFILINYLAAAVFTPAAAVEAARATRLFLALADLPFFILLVVAVGAAMPVMAGAVVAVVAS